MKLINKAIQELTEDRVKKIRFGKGQPKGVGSLKPNKSSGDTKKVGSASETTKKGSAYADMDITTGEHYDELDKEAKRQKKYKHSLSGDYDDGATDVVKIHEVVGSPIWGAYDKLKREFERVASQSRPSSEVDRLSTQFAQADEEFDIHLMQDLLAQLDAHNDMSGMHEGVNRMLQLAGMKDVKEMLVVNPKKELDEEGKEKKKDLHRKHGLIQENREYDKEHHQRFAEAVESAGLEVYHYRGRFFYEGPAVNVSHSEMPKLYAALHEAGFDGDDLQQDNMAFDKVVYPRH